MCTNNIQVMEYCTNHKVRLHKIESRSFCTQCIHVFAQYVVSTIFFCKCTMNVYLTLNYTPIHKFKNALKLLQIINKEKNLKIFYVSSFTTKISMMIVT